MGVGIATGVGPSKRKFQGRGFRRWLERGGKERKGLYGRAVGRIVKGDPEGDVHVGPGFIHYGKATEPREGKNKEKNELKNWTFGSPSYSQLFGYYRFHANLSAPSLCTRKYFDQAWYFFATSPSTHSRKPPLRIGEVFTADPVLSSEM